MPVESSVIERDSRRVVARSNFIPLRRWASSPEVFAAAAADLAMAVRSDFDWLVSRYKSVSCDSSRLPDSGSTSCTKLRKITKCDGFKGGDPGVRSAYPAFCRQLFSGRTRLW